MRQKAIDLYPTPEVDEENEENVDAIQQNQQPLPPPIKKTVRADKNVLDDIALAYKQNYSKEPWYKAPQKNADGSLSLTFKDEETATKFNEDRAKAGDKFIVTDGHTKDVIGYSDGSGTFTKNTEKKSFEEIQAVLDEQSPRPSL